MSLTIGSMLHQRCDVYTVKNADEFGNGAQRTPIVTNRACRFVHAEQVEFSTAAGGYVRTGSAAAWLSGRVAGNVGDIFVDRESNEEFRIVRVSMPRDLLVPGVDHTKFTLE